MTRTLVFGGAGFVGHHLVARLVAAGHAVTVFDSLVRGTPRRLAPFLDEGRVALVTGDVGDATAVRAVVAGTRPDVVFHLAALHFIPYCVAHPAETLAVNVVGTQHVLDALAAVPGARLVLASTADVYAPSPRPHTEDDAVATGNVYGASKLMCEQLLEIARRTHRAPLRAARLFNVFGTGETNPHVLPDILDGIRRGGPLRLGNLEPLRDYVHGADVALGLLAIAGYDGPETVFNLGTGVGTSVRELLDTLAAVLGRPLAVSSDPAKLRPVERPSLVADPTRARRELGWRARVSLRDGLRELVEHELGRSAA